MNADRTGAGRRRVRLAGFLAVLVASSAVSAWLGSRLDSPAQRAARAAPPPPSVITVPVAQRTLVDQVTGSASVRLTDSQAIAVDGAGADTEPVITAMPSRTGGRVAAGDVLFEIAGRPVFALPGAFPAYRDFTPGVSGPDVRQLQQALAGLGFGSGPDRAGTFGAGTQRAVARFYRQAGFTPQAVPVGPAGSGPAPATATGTGWPRREVAFVRRLPAQVSSVAAGVGGRADGTVLTLGFGAAQVRASVSPEDSTGLHAGQAATVTDGAGHATAATVRSVGSIQTDKAGRDRVPVVLQPKDGALRVGDGYTFRVVLRRSGPDDLVVPVTALWSGGDGQVMVTVLGGAGARRDVPVHLALTVDGEAAITPTGGGRLVVGDRVVVGTRGDSVVTAEH